MSAISEYIKCLEKCNNADCELKCSCARFNSIAKRNLKIDNPCSLYFATIEQNENDAVQNLKDIFGFK